jgi:hypothetical protein
MELIRQGVIHGGGLPFSGKQHDDYPHLQCQEWATAFDPVFIKHIDLRPQM